MRVLQLLAAAAVASAFVFPDEQMVEALSPDSQEPLPKSMFDSIPSIEEAWQDLDEAFTKSVGCAKHKFNEAVDATIATAVKFSENFDTAFAGESWLESAVDDLDVFDELDELERPPHRRRPPHHPGKKPPHRRPHHPLKSNMTVFQLIAKSKYTTKLAKLISEYDDLVELLNGTTTNFTVFAPTDKAFEKIPKHAPKPSKEFLKDLLTYHVSPDFYPAGKVLVSRTIPTLYTAKAIGGAPQRLSTQLGFRGLSVNFYSKVVAVNIFGTNGVIHGIDSILLPPPKAVDILSAFPGQFSTLDLALVKTGLFPLFNNTSTHVGGTFFAPSNFAFKKLGPKINAFLFSKFGEKYLKALVLYHVADNFTLYSDAYYKVDPEVFEAPGVEGVPKSRFHTDLPSGLEGELLSIDVARYGRFITMKINAFTKVAVLDGIAADGVIHVVPNVLIPPKHPKMDEEVSDELSVEELKERLGPFVQEDQYNFEL